MNLECSRFRIFDYEFSNFTNLECSRLRIFDYEFSNFTNLECSYVIQEHPKNTPN